jgi:hypothetical protein
MASVRTFKQNGRDVTMFAIDHTVGRGGVNQQDDVQLIQILINRYIALKAAHYDKIDDFGRTKGKDGRQIGDARVLDESGRQVKELKVDGLCGPRTLGAILAAQRSMNRWKGATVDGRIDPIQDGGRSRYKDGTVYKGMEMTRFNGMYLLGLTGDWEPNPPWDIFDLPEPLKSSLMRSSMEKSIGFVVGRLGQGQGLAR